jgi:hypothetical protein
MEKAYQTPFYSAELFSEIVSQAKGLRCPAPKLQISAIQCNAPGGDLVTKEPPPDLHQKEKRPSFLNICKL